MPDQWERISGFFSEVSKLHPSQRREYLDRVCPDKAIRDQVEDLLQHHTPEPFLGVPASLEGVLLGHYRMIERIGAGSMGEIYKAEDVTLGRVVAAKFLAQSVTGVPRFREKLIQEARRAAALKHPNIVTVHEIASADGNDFIVMEYIIGKTLQKAIPAGGLPAELALHYAIQIADALYTAHVEDILHGDLKPSNIMVTEAEDAKLLDFGLAKVLAGETQGVPQAESFGTVTYMSPERLRNRVNDRQSEIFAVGIIVYQMLCGRHPFGTGTPIQVAEAIQRIDPEPLPKTIPAQFASVVRRCLAKDPLERYASMQEVVIELWACEENQGKSEQPASDPPLGTVTTGNQEVDDALKIAERVNYNNAVKSREALESLTRLLETGISDSAREAVSRVLRELILTVPPNADGIPPQVRHIRKIAFAVLKRFVRGDFSSLFSGGDLERLDLAEMDFSGARLTGLSFRKCFLIHADFRKADLSRCSFSGAWLRNACFENCDLTAADLTETDWFNAVGLTGRQLAAALRGTVMLCPPDLQSCREYMAFRYRFSFDGWSALVRNQLTATWDEYLRPGGLRDLVLSWHRPAQ